MKRWISLLLAVLTLLAASMLPAAASDQEDGMTVQYFHDFEAARASDSFSSDAENFGISYVTGRFYTVKGKDKAIAGSKSLRVNSCDMRWWMVNYSERTMGFSMLLSCDEAFDNTFYYCIQSDDPDTSTENGWAGRIFSIRRDGEQAALCDYDGTVLARFDRDGAVHTVEAVFTKGSAIYTISLDGETVSDSARFACDVYSIYGLKMVCEAENRDSYITVDNIRAYTVGQVYPQTNSFQEKGPLPTVTLPTPLADEGYSVYLNTDKISPDCAYDERDGVLALDAAAVLRKAGWEVSAEESGKLTATSPEGRVAVMQPASDFVRIGDQFIQLAHPLYRDADVTYAPLQLFAELLDAKVWQDAAHNMLVLSTGAFKNDGILRSIGAMFYQNGQPYYEISFNKFDLWSQISSDPAFNNGAFGDRSYDTEEHCLQGAEEALSQLHARGFKTIRVFMGNCNLKKNAKTVERFWAVTDKMFALCDQYDIQVVCCMGLFTSEFLEGKYAGGSWVTTDESYYDYIVNPESKSRQNMTDFLRAFADRYKDRSTILMYEVSNEGNLNADVGSGTAATYSLGQLGDFYNDVADVLHAADPARMVTSGDGMFRSAQWHLYAATMAGKSMDWTVDTISERIKALWLVNSHLDCVSIHGYDVGYESGNGHSSLREDSGKSRFVTWTDYLEEARALNLPLYNGEVGGMNGHSAKHSDANAAEYRAEYLQGLIDAGVQLSHWWTFHSDRGGEFGYDDEVFSITEHHTPESLDAIDAANRALKEKWVVNAAADANTMLYRTGSFTAYTGTLSFAAQGEEPTLNPIYPLLAAASVAAAIGAGTGVLSYMRKKNKGKKKKK